MHIAMASDHAGFSYKQEIQKRLEALGHSVHDFGTNSSESCDYPDFIHPAAEAVSSGRCERGIVLGGSGNGEAMAANRHAGVRCALVWNEQSARLGRHHNDANMISIGERMVSLETAFKLVEIFLDESFEGGRHIRRIAKIEEF